MAFGKHSQQAIREDQPTAQHCQKQFNETRRIVEGLICRSAILLANGPVYEPRG